jgi:DNA invertase Pin-like site-specific DNA recombinase
VHCDTRALGYVRVSTSEQADNGVGLQAQRDAIQAECERRGWVLVGLEEDAGVSGKTLDRPGLGRALERVQSGEAQALVVAKLDRLSRSVLDFASLMEQAATEGWGVVALDLGADSTTAQGEMLVNVLVSFAQFERKLIGQRTRGGCQAFRVSAWWDGRGCSCGVKW